MSLARTQSPRAAFRAGLLIGIGCIAPHLAFFWGIFGPAALALWFVLAFWTALFALLLGFFLRSFRHGLLLTPVLWTGLEYFRSECYYLRFSWLNAGYAFGPSPLVHIAGMYGLGFIAASMAGVVSAIPARRRWWAFPALAGGLLWVTLPAEPRGGASPKMGGPLAVGIQLEFPTGPEILAALDKAFDAHPSADMFILSEYTLASPPTEALCDWCRRRGRYLIVGGIQPMPPRQQYANTAFVIGPAGDTVFSQGKSVPIQFFSDGHPAREQHLWRSPWGKLGICICYDLSYRQVTDRLIGQGAQAILVPTMDVETWGRHEHELHARVAPVRAAEYGVPIVRVCSSGISQIVEPDGAVSASAPFAGEGEIVAGRIRIGSPGRLPLDHWLAPACTAVTCVLMPLAIFFNRRKGKRAAGGLEAPAPGPHPAPQLQSSE